MPAVLATLTLLPLPPLPPLPLPPLPLIATATPTPTATLTPTASPTPVPPTRTPTATNTPLAPTATRVARTATTRITIPPSPTSTPMAIVVGPGPAPGTSPVPTATATPKGTRSPIPTRTPAIGRTPPPSTAPPLHVRVLSPLVQPGADAPVAVSYVEDALVQAVVHMPGQDPVTLVDTTDSHGYVTLVVRVPRHVPLRRGHAVADLVVRATSGRWYRLATRTLLVHPGATWPIAGSYTPRTPVRVLVTFPGVRPVRLLAVTDSHGHLRLTLRVPRNVTLHHGQVLAHATISALASTRRAQVTRILSISDMVVSVARGPIVSCLQMQTVHVAYHPNVRLSIVLLFPNDHRLALTAHTNQRGVATVNLQVHYVQAPNPVRIGVEAIDTSVRPPRLERITVAVVLPPACRFGRGIQRSTTSLQSTEARLRAELIGAPGQFGVLPERKPSSDEMLIRLGAGAREHRPGSRLEGAQAMTPLD